MKDTADTEKNTIMIAGDSQSLPASLTDILGDEYEILTATSGQDAVDKAKEFLPDLILLESDMPGMDGYEATEILKNSETACEIPIILITERNNDDSERKGLSSGAADFIVKPFDPVIVRFRIENQIRVQNQLRFIKMLSTIDQLTSMPNRRSFDARLDLEWNRAKRDMTQCSILLVDVDHFKIYNDTYGHLNGDAALKGTAGIIKDALKRPGDYAARWGGEEFIILLPATDMEGALGIAEKIRASVEELVISILGYLDTKLTVSIGVNTQIPAQGSTIEKFIDEADKALYTAKRTGRNKVCRFQSKKKRRSADRITSEVG